MVGTHKSHSLTLPCTHARPSLFSESSAESDFSSVSLAGWGKKWIVTQSYNSNSYLITVQPHDKSGIYSIPLNPFSSIRSCLAEHVKEEKKKKLDNQPEKTYWKNYANAAFSSMSSREEISEPQVALQTSCRKSITGERPPWPPILLGLEPQQVVSTPA